MADQRSIEMLAFNFASRTFAYRRLAQGLSRALSALSSFMRENLDKVLEADQCAQYVDDIGIAANDADHLIANLRATFKCIQEAGLKLTMHKCHFGAKEIDFLGRTITPQGVKPQKQNVQNFLEKTKFPKSKKALQRYVGFLNYYRNYFPRISERLAPFYKMLKSDEKVLVSKKLVQQFEEINKALDKCGDLALEQPIPNKQIALMTDASFGAAGYVVLIEDDPSQIYVTQKDVCSGGIWIKNLHPSTDQDVNLCQRISCILLRIQRMLAYLLGCAETGYYPYRQQSCHAIFSNKNITPSPVECV